MINMKTKIEEPISVTERNIEIEIEKDLEAFNFIYYLGNKLKANIPDTVTLNYQYIKEQMSIAENMIPKDRLKEIKRKAKKHAEEDFNMIDRII